MPMNFPDSPAANAVFTSGGMSWIWTGSTWKAYGLPGAGATVADTAPVSTVNGNLWWNSSPGDGQLYLNYNDGSSWQWVVANNLGAGIYLPLTGGALQGDLYLQGHSLFFAGAAGSGNGYLVGDTNNITQRLPTGNGQFNFLNGTGGSLFTVVASSGNAQVNNNFIVGGGYLTFAGAIPAGINGTTNGPVIYSDQNAMVFHLGTGTSPAAFLYQNNTGTQWMMLNVNGISLAIGNFNTGGVNAAYNFADRAGGSNPTWTWYANGGNAALYNGTNGNVWLFGGFVMFPSSNNDHYLGDGSGTRGLNAIYSYNFVNLSDIRDKTNVRELPDCLDLLCELKPKRWRLTNGPEDERHITHWGFVAQDVGAVLKPHDFGGHREIEGYQSISYHELTAVLWKACQEMAAQIEELKARLS
jgi:hypothetical protein